MRLIDICGGLNPKDIEGSGVSFALLPKDVEWSGISFGLLPKDVRESGVSFAFLPKDVEGRRVNPRLRVEGCGCFCRKVGEPSTAG